MAKNTLEQIIEKKIAKINILKKNITIDSLHDKIIKNNSFVNFKEKIENNIKLDKISIIAEIKKASPSAGIIIKDYDPLKIAEIYNSNKATCLSVLTEEDFFFGNLTHIYKIKEKINARNPRTGERIHAKEKISIAFKMSEELKNRINSKEGSIN